MMWEKLKNKFWDKSTHIEELLGLDIEGGEIKRVKGIKAEGAEWAFSDNDPQIYISFTRPIWGLRYTRDIEWGEFTGREFSKIYFKDNSQEYSETNSCDIPFLADKKIVRELHFSRPIREIRFDPVEASGRCKVTNLKFLPIYEKKSMASIVKEEYHIPEAKEGVLIVTHSMSMTGAPILAFHIAKSMKEQGRKVVVLAREMGNGFLESKYEAVDIPVVPMDIFDGSAFAYIEFSEDDTWEVINRKNYVDVVAGILEKAGYSVAIVNSIVSGEYADTMKNKGIRLISLIHEMKTTIELYGFIEHGRHIADAADKIIFPNEIVKQDFLKLFPNVQGECMVKAQGVYLDSAIEPKKTEILGRYNISPSDIIIMSSGTCELRKGTDLFVETAILYLKESTKKNVHFIWTGEFYNMEFKGWLINQIERAGLEKKIHFVPFVQDPGEYKYLLENANIFLGLSREDPFPSTVLEAMDSNLPVIGFQGTGGVEVMLSEGRGILTSIFDLTEVVRGIDVLLEDYKTREKICNKAMEYVKQMKFSLYVQFLTEQINIKN